MDGPYAAHFLIVLLQTEHAVKFDQYRNEADEMNDEAMQDHRDKHGSDVSMAKHLPKTARAARFLHITDSS